MIKCPKLNRIPFEDYSERTYASMKAWHFEGFQSYLSDNYPISKCVNGYYFYDFEDEILEYGMEKFVAMICGMLFMMEHNEVDDCQVYAVNKDIEYFETGEYDDLFTPEDLEQIRADIQLIKDYIAKHPEQLREQPDAKRVYFGNVPY